jgi:hypothetical protein
MRIGLRDLREHHSAFSIGRVRDVVPSSDREGRYLIALGEYARVNIPDIWKGDRNPVKYATVEDLGIDFSTLSWEPMPARSEAGAVTAQSPETKPATSLTMAEAKQGLVVTFGVPPEAIETICG